MKMYLISDNTETYEGMRLAGVDGTVVCGTADTADALHAILDKDEYAVILITEKAYSFAPEVIDRVMATRTRPLITRIPDRHGGTAKTDSISEFIRNGIGLKI